LPAREAARRLGVPRSTLQRLLAPKPAKPTVSFRPKPGRSDVDQDGPESLDYGTIAGIICLSVPRLSAVLQQNARSKTPLPAQSDSC
jgi:hypothetical protein